MFSNKKLNEVKKITRLLNSSKMNIYFYAEMCLLFEIYNDLSLAFKIKNIENLESIKLIRNIAYSFNEILSIEDLVNIYPMYIKNHLHFIIINNTSQQNYKNMRKLINHPIIKNNEWIDTEILYIYDLYNYLYNNKETYPLSEDSLNKQAFYNNDIFQEKEITYSEYIKRLYSVQNNYSNNSIVSKVLTLLLGELNNVK
ncbi:MULTISPECIES: hypothetical protein [Staphylococcus]|uniref:hypothetical protein n=1 Tax=Staphylococcus TaxID=1279 RepID=UPI001C82D0FA|nr:MULTISPECIES: hypothetical protein [Staphylococcus]MBX5317029.1 hypothetical protein [Staphylococcus caprae]MBX5324335.1 hypothetical protein [Staphylococcus caprae]MDS3852920.1 hypothetical protein [Staphylococcus hominis]